MRRPRDEFWGGEDAAFERDEAEMDRDMQYAYDHYNIGWPQFILTKVKHLPDMPHMEARPRRNAPWRRG